MHSYLVTGANKGIGFALVKTILKQNGENFVYLGTRTLKNGTDAIQSLSSDEQSRVKVVEIDVTNEDSLQKLAHSFRSDGVRLNGIVNNAGIFVDEPFIVNFEVNFFGTMLVNEKFIEFLQDGGRIVHISSGSAPSFVSKLDEEKKNLFRKPKPTQEDVDGLVSLVKRFSCRGDSQKAGFADGAGYGFSKACLNVYNRFLSLKYPQFKINACSPGYIETDMTQRFIPSGGVASDVGMKTPEEGTKAPMYLLFGDVPLTGAYYGSDALRSPVDEYRSPGAPAYEPKDPNAM